MAILAALFWLFFWLFQGPIGGKTVNPNYLHHHFRLTALDPRGSELSKKLSLHWQLPRKSSCCVPIPYRGQSGGVVTSPHSWKHDEILMRPLPNCCLLKLGRMQNMWHILVIKGRHWTFHSYCSYPLVLRESRRTHCHNRASQVWQCWSSSRCEII